MYELIQAGENTWYMDCPTKVGLVRTASGHGVLIDGGSDKDAAKKVLRHMEALGLSLDAVYCTHAHADHIGGCRHLQNSTGCKIYVPEDELAYPAQPILEPAMLYGGRPPKVLCNKFLMAPSFEAEALTADVLPEGFRMELVGGHCAAMALLQTPDGVWFAGDAVASEETLQKYPVSYLMDVDGFLAALDKVETLTGTLFVPAHAPASGDITSLAEVNRRNTLELCAMLKGICAAPSTMEDILKAVFDRLGHTLNWIQYVLVGCTLRSYLACLMDKGELVTDVADNRLLWKLPEEA